MTLTFVNPERKVDERNRYIRFWASDGAKEVACYLDIAALKVLNPHMTDVDSEFLEEFDKSLDRIHEVTRRVYSRSGKGAYVCTVTANNFLM